MAQAQARNVSADNFNLCTMNVLSLSKMTPLMVIASAMTPALCIASLSQRGNACGTPWGRTVRKRTVVSAPPANTDCTFVFASATGLAAPRKIGRPRKLGSELRNLVGAEVAFQCTSRHRPFKALALLAGQNAREEVRK